MYVPGHPEGPGQSKVSHEDAQPPSPGQQAALLHFHKGKDRIFVPDCLLLGGKGMFGLCFAHFVGKKEKKNTMVLHYDLSGRFTV